MKIVNYFSKNISHLDKESVSKVIRDVIAYNNIEIEEKMLFSSTAYYSFKGSNGLISKEAFPLKLFIPDFILENFSLHDKEQKTLILNFLKIFINELIFLTYSIDLNKKQYLYTSGVKKSTDDIDFFQNKRNLILFFSKYFKEKIVINENLPKKIMNTQQFVLGKNCLHSKKSAKSFLIGSHFYSFLNRISVTLQIHGSELENLKIFLKIIGVKYMNLLFSKQSLEKKGLYKFKFVFEKNKCISVFSYPNKIINNQNQAFPLSIQNKG